jgi:hypothetical protein
MVTIRSRLLMEEVEERFVVKYLYINGRGNEKITAES